MNYNTISKLEIVFSHGDFADSAQEDREYPEAVINEWRAQYYAELTAELRDMFPNAEIELREGYDQTHDFKLYWEGGEGDGDWYGDEDELRADVHAAMGEVWNAGTFWEILDPEATLAAAIEEVTGFDDVPVARIEMEQSSFAFARLSNGRYAWMDLYATDKLHEFFEDGEWQTGTLEEAAAAFVLDANLSPADKVSDLITQARAAEIAGVSVQAVHNAIRDGRLRGHENRQAVNPQKGATLVSEAQVRAVWGS